MTRIKARCPTCGEEHVLRLEHDPLRSHDVRYPIMCKECWNDMRDRTGPHVAACTLARTALQPCGCNPDAASIYIRGT